ncbi:RHS repeat-associated core domain-containing protein [Pseudoalteromonas sp. N1230-9]|uniref:RHS repeat domain-containing protein n=1 Tax=Pseudoalteromonas sp. N1230-9 TaxID=2907156 RepID=UPI002B2D07DA|nr:RHS repeat-associated core domain-containing protein [Pseudoalteromonas sp. N1230-9]
MTTQRNYDPFGKPCLASGGLMPVGNAKLNDLADAKTRRGFTDHEHLDDIELIHMNGRVYDYNLGRFMSVDPVIQSPTNDQSINPYSYIMNNPLAGVDPTGYSAVCASSGTCPIDTVVTTKSGEEKSVKMTEAAFKKINSQIQKNGSSSIKVTAKNKGTISDIGSSTSNQKEAINEPNSFSETSKEKSSKLSGFDLDIDRVGGISNEYFGSVNASYSDFKEDEDGNTIQATSTCDSVCQKEAIDQGRITSTDISRSIMRLRMREYQGYAAGYSSIWAAGSARHIIYNISSFTFKQFRKFNELPTKQKEACISMFLGLCAQEVLRMNF